MTDLDNSRASGSGTAEGASPAEGGRPPFFPAPPGRHATPPAGVPLSGTAGAGTVAPTLLPPGRHQRSPQEPQRPEEARREKTAGGEQAAEARPQAAAVVKGRITIEDEVVEKIAALAAGEVDGVAALSERAQAVRVHRGEGEMSLDLTVVVEYGCVIMDVAKAVKANVARVVGLMLGARVSAVNVVIDDVRPPAGAQRGRA